MELKSREWKVNRYLNKIFFFYNVSMTLIFQIAEHWLLVILASMLMTSRT